MLCEWFIPLLAQVYKELSVWNADFEIVLVPCEMGEEPRRVWPRNSAAMATAAPPPSKRRRQDQQDKAISESSATKGNTPLVVFAHGAGAPSTSEWMLRWKKKIEEELNAIVVTFDYPFADISGGKRKAPPKAEKLVDHLAHSSIIEEAEGT